MPGVCCGQLCHTIKPWSQAPLPSKKCEHAVTKQYHCNNLGVVVTAMMSLEWQHLTIKKAKWPLLELIMQTLLRCVHTPVGDCVFSLQRPVQCVGSGTL